MPKKICEQCSGLRCFEEVEDFITWRLEFNAQSGALRHDFRESIQACVERKNLQDITKDDE